MKRTLSSTLRLGARLTQVARVMLALFAAVGFSHSAHAQFSVTITVDENGNGHFSNTDGISLSLPFALLNDPGPGGLNNVLTYSLLNPPGLASGDVLISEPGGALGDVVRFNANQTCSDGSFGCLVFYSLTGGNSLADSLSPPSSFYANTIDIAEIGGAATYTPTSAQPGFVAGAAGPVTYVIHSDVPVPEPGTLALFAVGLCGFMLARRRTRRVTS